MMVKRFYTNAGSPVKIKKIAKIEKDGMINLIDGEKTDFQAYIDSFRDQTDIETIITRFQNGDVAALSKAQGFYADVSDMPKSYSEVLNMVNEGQAAFDKLPTDVKQKFGSDFNVWFSTMGTDSWYEKMESPMQKVKKEVSEMVKNSEGGNKVNE